MSEARAPRPAGRARAAAPPVAHPTGRAPRLALALAGLWVAGLLTMFLMLFEPSALDGKGFVAILFVVIQVLTGAALFGLWRAQTPRELRWSGEQWSLGAAEGAPEQALARVHVHLDLQRALLLRGQGRERASDVWLWAERGAEAWRWHLLRCALYSTARSAAPADAGEALERT